MNLVATRTGRRAVFAALYVSEGGPIGYIWWALPTELRVAGVEVEKITAITAMLVLPWIFKFAWAPLVDTLRGPRVGYRHWIVGAQIMMGLTLLATAWLDPLTQLPLFAGLLIAHALCAATQDVAIDAWAIGVTPHDERGSVSGWMQVGMLSGRWLFGAGLLLVAGAVSRPIIIGALVAVVWVTSLLVLLSAEPEAPRQRGAFFSALRAALAQRRTWAGLALALTCGAAFEAVGAVAGPFLIDIGYGKVDVGIFYTGSVIAMLIGSIAGGFMSDRIGHRAAVALFVVYVALMTAALAAAPPGYSFNLLVTVYLGIGLLTAASYALFMDLTDPRLGGTQFSAYMGATNGCESWSAFAVGRFISMWGYSVAFGAMAGLSLLALPVLLMLRKTPRGRGG